MSDVNVVISTIDYGMDIIDKYIEEVKDAYAYVKYEINSSIESVRNQQLLVETQILNNSEDKSDDYYANLYRKNEQLKILLQNTTIMGEELSLEWTRMCNRSIDIAESSKRAMGEYLRKLNGINENSHYGGISSNSQSEYYVVIVDSTKYPQTAEHIKVAQRIGLPEFVTIDRKEAANRRKESLSNIRKNKIYDRDEWPMAVFAEGGKNANVRYIEPSDNRGAGASISWQMRAYPDGTRIRVRVI